jgi:hypothetical protein
VTATPSTICAGATSSINVSTLVSGVNYNVYTAATGGTNLGAIPQTVSPTTTTTYYVEAVNSADPACVSTSRTPVTITVNAAPTATVGSNSPICAGQTLNLTNNTLTGATYAWSGPSGYTSTAQNPSLTNVTSAMAGTYSVTVTNGGCSATSSVTVAIGSQPTATAAANSPLCSGATLNLSTPTSAGSTYSWTGPSSYTSTSQNPTRTNVTSSMAGTYTVTVTAPAANGATGTGTATATVIVLPSTDPLCGCTVTASNNGPVLR